MEYGHILPKEEKQEPPKPGTPAPIGPTPVAEGGIVEKAKDVLGQATEPSPVQSIAGK